MSAVVDVAVFRSSGSPQSLRIELSESGPAQIVSGAPRSSLAAFNNGPDLVVFYTPNHKELEPLEVGVGVVVTGLDPEQDVWVKLALDPN